MQNLPIELLSIFFPSELMKFFAISKYEILNDKETNKDYFEITFEEKNEVPDGYVSDEYESKGFMESKHIQDFPIRGLAVYILLKKRRWRHKKTKKNIKRDFTFMCKGAKFTTELSDFLKDTGR